MSNCNPYYTLWRRGSNTNLKKKNPLLTSYFGAEWFTKLSFLGASAKLCKVTIHHVCLSVCLCVHKGQLSSYWTDFHEN